MRDRAINALSEVHVDDGEDALLLRIQVRPHLVSVARIGIALLLVTAIVCPVIDWDVGIAVAIPSIVACLPLGFVLILARTRVEWLVEADGIHAAHGGSLRFVPFDDIKDFEYLPWVPSYNDGEAGHGGTIKAQLTGPSLRGDNLQFGRGLSGEQLADALAALTRRLNHYRDGNSCA